MAPSTINDEAPVQSGLDGANSPPEGIVLPPKDIQGAAYYIRCPSLKDFAANSCAAIVEKTADYVARNGVGFEGSGS